MTVCLSHWISRSGIALVLVWVAGCATPPSPVSPAAQSAWAARQPALMKLTHWRAAGRIGVVNERNGWHASFQWDQQDADYRIDLIGPLGQGRVIIQGDMEAVHIQTQDGKDWTAPDSDTLLEQSLGVRLPVNGLRYWVRGLPEPDSQPVLQFDAGGRLIRLEQSGWIIEYPIYTPVAALDLPARIVAQRQDLSVKLIIEQWTL